MLVLCHFLFLSGYPLNLNSALHTFCQCFLLKLSCRSELPTRTPLAPDQCAQHDLATLQFRGCIFYFTANVYSRTYQQHLDTNLFEQGQKEEDWTTRSLPGTFHHPLNSETVKA